MKRLSLIIGIIPSIGLAIHNMEYLSFENAIAYGMILWFSFIFIKALWTLTDKKTKK